MRGRLTGPHPHLFGKAQPVRGWFDQAALEKAATVAVCGGSRSCFGTRRAAQPSCSEVKDGDTGRTARKGLALTAWGGSPVLRRAQPRLKKGRSPS
jgi:hypothetical protein